MTGTAKSRTKAAEKPERGGVQSVRIAAKILKALAQGDGAQPLKRLASATGLARAKVHRYLLSLRNTGLVSQDPDSGHYQIGPAAVAERIRAKIGWTRGPNEGDGEFLDAYYRALRGRLESRLLLGRRRKDKHDSP